MVSCATVSTMKAIDRAVRAAGGMQALADMCGVSYQAIQKWRSRRRRAVPAERVLQIERFSGISRHELRPDLYPREKPVEPS